MKPFINSLFARLFLLAALGFCSVVASAKSTDTSEPKTKPGIPVSAQNKKVKSNTNTSPKPEKLTVQTATARLKEWDKKLKFMETVFNQKTSYDGVLISQSQGKLYYAKDAHVLRLDTQAQDGTIQQSAVTDKKTLILLDEKAEEITRLSWTDWQQGQPNKALFDFGNYTALLEEHNAVLFEDTPQYAVLRLTPKSGEQYQLFLSLSKEDFFPKVITIFSDLMQTEAQLMKTVKNANLNSTLFKEVTKK